MWCIPDITLVFRERMYDILDLYAEPYDPKRPILGVDEKPKQLIGNCRKPIPMRPGRPERYDYEYIRNGNANIFMAAEFKAGRRIARVTSRRTKRDFAKFIKHLVDKVYPDAETLRLVVDNLNTHDKDAFREMYGAKEAKRILGRVEFHYTPLHASWLNVAEIEIGAMDAECTGRRIGNKCELRKEVMAWMTRRNKQKKNIEWKFTRQKADEKMSKYYVT